LLASGAPHAPDATCAARQVINPTNWPTLYFLAIRLAHQDASDFLRLILVKEAKEEKKNFSVLSDFFDAFGF